MKGSETIPRLFASYKHISTIELFSPAGVHARKGRFEKRPLLLKITFLKGGTDTHATKSIMHDCVYAIILFLATTGLAYEDIPIDHDINVASGTIVFYQPEETNGFTLPHYNLLVAHFMSYAKEMHHHWLVSEDKTSYVDDDLLHFHTGNLKN